MIEEAGFARQIMDILNLQHHLPLHTEIRMKIPFTRNSCHVVKSTQFNVPSPSRRERLQQHLLIPCSSTRNASDSGQKAGTLPSGQQEQSYSTRRSLVAWILLAVKYRSGSKMNWTCSRSSLPRNVPQSQDAQGNQLDLHGILSVTGFFDKIICFKKFGTAITVIGVTDPQGRNK
jgi:hypothetical protein